MRSIRLSLILYFLVLLAAALGGVSWFCYQSTEQALKGKEAKTLEFWQAKYEENCKRTRDAFDADLLAHAKNVTNGAIWVNFWEWGPILGALGNGPHSTGHLTTTLSVAGSLNPIASYLHWKRPPTIRLYPPDDEGFAPSAEPGHYFQTYRVVKGPPASLEMMEQSDSLEYEEIVFRLDEAARQRADAAPYFDEIDLGTVGKVRRVTFRAQAARTLWLKALPAPPRPPMGGKGLPPGSKGPLMGGKGPPRGPKGGKEPFRGWPLPEPGTVYPLRGGYRPVFYVQYAQETAARDKQLAEFAQNLARDRAQLRDELNGSLSDLRHRLFWISLGAFVALVAGGYWLVRLGLAPLHRLSEAVSQVSEKDFRLPIDQARLPTELQPIVARLTQTLDQLRRAFERDKQAAADISHDLRTPLAALLTTLDIALRKPRSSEEYREVLQECRASGQQMYALVERLLTLARLDAGVDHLRPREVDVAALAEQCAALVRPLAEARGLQLRVHNGQPAAMSADPDKLREVVTNLLHNAIEYNRPDGSIDLAVTRDNGDVRVEVKDTGIGIAESQRQRIFERFYRSDPSRQTEGMHTGLGLAIVKGYVDLMGGSIDVESTVGQGSTFKVRLPAAPPSRA